MTQIRMPQAWPLQAEMLGADRRRLIDGIGAAKRSSMEAYDTFSSNLGCAALLPATPSADRPRAAGCLVQVTPLPF
jgi:hypothetical protein